MAEGVGEGPTAFERFNQAMGVGVVADPYSPWVAQRARHVVPIEGSLRTLAADDGAVPPIVVAFSYDAVHEVLRDGHRFSSSRYADIIGDIIGHSIIEMDEPEHHGYRGLLQPVFSRRAMERWETGVVGPVVDGFLDRIVADGDGRDGLGHAELVRQLTFPFPIHVIATMLGLPLDQLDVFHRLAVELISVVVDRELAARASRDVAALLRPLIDRRRVEPGDDLISVLAQADHDGQRLTDEEIISFCRLLLPAGAETTYRASSNLLVGLLTHPEQLAAVRDDRSLIPQAIEEGLRWEPPLLTQIIRSATEDTEVCGVPVPAGAVVVVNLGSANRDERYWDDPDRFDIFRLPHPIMSFGWGPHLCLGMHLARMEIRVLLEQVLDRLPGLRLDPEADAPVITGRTFRSPSEVRVVFAV
jgi:cytochrome P450